MSTLIIFVIPSKKSFNVYLLIIIPCVFIFGFNANRYAAAFLLTRKSTIMVKVTTFNGNIAREFLFSWLIR